MTKDQLMDIVPSLVKIGKKHKLRLLIVFGSLAKDEMRTLSDVDIAFLKDKKVDLKEWLAIIGDLQDVFHREDVDVIELFGANPLLKMCVLKGGVFVYSKSRKDMVSFRYITISEFLATQYLRSQFSYYLKKSVFGGV